MSLLGKHRCFLLFIFCVLGMPGKLCAVGGAGETAQLRQEVQTLQDFIKRLRIVLGVEGGDLSANHDDLVNIANDLISKIDGDEQRQKGLAGDLVAVELELASLQEQLAEKTASEEQSAEKDAALVSLKEQLEQKGTTIETLQSDLNAVTERLAAAEEDGIKVTDVQSLLNQLTQDTEGQLEGLNEGLDEPIKLIDGLSNKFEALQEQIKQEQDKVAELEEQGGIDSNTQFEKLSQAQNQIAILEESIKGYERTIADQEEQSQQTASQTVARLQQELVRMQRQQQFIIQQAEMAGVAFGSRQGLDQLALPLEDVEPLDDQLREVADSLDDLGRLPDQLHRKIETLKNQLLDQKEEIAELVSQKGGSSVEIDRQKEELERQQDELEIKEKELNEMQQRLGMFSAGSQQQGYQVQVLGQELQRVKQQIADELAVLTESLEQGEQDLTHQIDAIKIDSLKGSVQALINDRNQLASQEGQLVDQLRYFQNRLAELQGLVHEKMPDLLNIEKQIVEIEASLSGQEAKIEQAFYRQRMQFEQELTSAQNDLNLNVSVLRQNLQGMQRENQGLHASLESVRSQLDEQSDASVEVVKLSGVISDMTEKFDAANLVVASLEEELSKILGEHADQKISLEAFQTQNEDLKQQLDNLTRGMNVQGQQARALMEQLQAVQLVSDDQFNSMVAALDGMEQRMTDLDDAVNNLTISFNAYERAKEGQEASYERQLNEYKGAINSLNEQVENHLNQLQSGAFMQPRPLLGQRY